jgi:hypothetical protein
MDGYGDSFKTSSAEVDGQSVSVRIYDNSNESTRRHFDECTKLVDKRLPIKAPTVRDLEGLYKVLVKQMDCMRSEGFDMGLTVSNSEYVTSGGQVRWTSSWDAIATDQRFFKVLDTCIARFPNPEVS